MSTTAPKPPSKKFLLATGLTIGITIGMWAIVGVGHFVFSGIPENRMTWYITAGLVFIAASSCLGTRYVVQKNRRDAWWEGFAAGDEPLAEVVQLRGLKALDDDTQEQRANSPS